MKKNILIISFWLLFISPIFAQDTIKITLDNATKMWITSPDRASLLKLKYLDINHLVRDALKGTDSTQNKNTPPKSDNPDEVDTDIDDEEDTYSIRYIITDGIRIKRAVRDSILKTRKWIHYNNWDIDVGFSNVLEGNKFPDNLNKPYGLSTAGSRYFAISTNEHFKFYKKAVSLKIGLELSVQNLMYQGNNYIMRNTAGDSILFRNYNTDFQRNLSRSKLVITHLNIPFALRIEALKRNGKSILSFDLGGYAGYRIGSYSSVKVSGERNKQRTSNNFLLNNWRYGLEFVAQISNVRLFARYDLNPLFATAQMPTLNMMTFGFRL